MAVRYLILKDAISADQLRALPTRFNGSEAVSGVREDESYPCWSVPAAAVRRLAGVGYDISRKVVITTDRVFLALANPDGTPAIADTDPNTMRSVTVKGSCPAAVNEFTLTRAVKKLLVPLFKKDIQLEFCSGRGVPTPADTDTSTCVQMRFYASVLGAQHEASVCTAAVLGHTEINGGHRWCEMWPGGAPVYDPETFVEIGAYDASNVFVYFNTDFFANPSQLVMDFIQVLHDQYLAPVAVPQAVVAEKYVDACAAKAHLEREKLSNVVKTAGDIVADLQRQIVAKIREFKTAEHRLEYFSKYEESIKGQLRVEFERLVSMPAVRRVDWRADTLTVDVTELYAIDPRSGHEHEIGAFRFVIASGSSEVRMYNLTRQVKAFNNNLMHAPHVFPNGRPCLGNMAGVIPALVSNYEWAPAISLCISFVEAVNVDDAAGKYIDKWPVARTAAEVEEGATRPREREALQIEAELAEEAEFIDDTPAVEAESPFGDMDEFFETVQLQTDEQLV